VTRIHHRLAVAGAAAPLAVLVMLAASPSAPAADTPDTIVERFLSRTDVPLIQYRATRRLDARNARFKVEGWMEARTWLGPDGRFGYEVTGEGGSGLIRKRVLRAALEAEAESVAGGGSRRAALTTDNYTFVAEPATGEGPRRVRMTARRKDVLLLDGFLTLAAEDADLLEIEGRVTKNPSFWTSRIEVARSYGRINGVRVPVRFDSTAWVKIAGRSEFSMVYTYESINGQPVGHPQP
jgi:hypothetical protein